MSKVVCIPCINMEIDDRFLIHGTSDKKCSICNGGRGDGLVISIIGSYEEDHDIH